MTRQKCLSHKIESFTRVMKVGEILGEGDCKTLQDAVGCLKDCLEGKCTITTWTLVLTLRRINVHGLKEKYDIKECD